MSVIVLALVLAQLLGNGRSIIQLQFLGKPLDNNTYIYSSRISHGISAVKCLLVNATDCCQGLLDSGSWRDENGRQIQEGAGGSSCLYVTRGEDGAISLNRKSGCKHSPGVWRCDVPLGSGRTESLHIYIVSEGCDLTVLVTGGVGGGMGFIIIVQALVIMCLLRYRPCLKQNIKVKTSQRSSIPKRAQSIASGLSECAQSTAGLTNAFNTKIDNKRTASVNTEDSSRVPTFAIRPRLSVDVEHEEEVETCVNSVYETVSKISTMDDDEYVDIDSICLDPPKQTTPQTTPMK